MPRKSLAVLTLIAAVLAVSASAQAAPTTRTVATVATLDQRAVVVAHKASAGRAPTAQVTVTTYVRAPGGWHHVADRRLDGPFFWNTVTASHAVCRLEVKTGGSPTAARQSLTVQLLTSPSIGCGRAQTIPFPAP